MVSKIQPGHGFTGHSNYGKVKGHIKVHHNVVHLQLEPITLHSINILPFMVSKTQHRQDIKGQSHHSKVKSNKSTVKT